MGGAILGTALAELGAHQLGYLGLHQLSDQQRQRFAQHIGVLVDEHLRTTSSVVILY